MGFRMGPLVAAMMEYERGAAQRINHFLKVYSFAKLIGEQESLAAPVQETLEAAAIVHDIGIRPSLEKYQSSGGNFQEIEGPPVAREILTRLGFPDGMVERVCFLVGHHHTYRDIEGEDYRILVEADFLVNLHEEKADKQTVLMARKNIFRTKAGTKALNDLFALPG
ncbi:HD domain-containing protein [Christensenella tenuis]|jgi:uncharacterized protein|uniref:HD domain-containing protein n=1 Tax=Christensenella tenuis TaxID=2763033 RepID=A0ABR7EEA6_9FIRM|nr:HD domain-containing protein [Christensenella tenuis]MBC5647676.1 HD domain-containing protein [Christensenella tenuis]